MPKPVPVGTETPTKSGYVRVKVSEDPTVWKYKHVVVAEQMLGRELNWDERAMFKKGAPREAVPENIEIVKRNPEVSRRPPKRRAYVIRHIKELRHALDHYERELVQINRAFGRPEDDMTGPAKPRENELTHHKVKDGDVP